MPQQQLEAELISIRPAPTESVSRKELLKNEYVREIPNDKEAILVTTTGEQHVSGAALLIRGLVKKGFLPFFVLLTIYGVVQLVTGTLWMASQDSVIAGSIILSVSLVGLMLSLCVLCCAKAVGPTTATCSPLLIHVNRAKCPVEASNIQAIIVETSGGDGLMRFHTRGDPEYEVQTGLLPIATVEAFSHAIAVYYKLPIR